MKTFRNEVLMKKLFALFALTLLAATVPAKAAPGAALVEEQYKAALSRLTQDVRQAQSPTEKREILHHFINGMQDGLQKAESLESIQVSDRETLRSVAGKFDAYNAELDGMNGYARVADADLDAFAGYVQQGMEQAPMNGGIYLSGTALIVILLLLIFLL
jgi:hypothetical protein